LESVCKRNEPGGIAAFWPFTHDVQTSTSGVDPTTLAALEIRVNVKPMPDSKRDRDYARSVVGAFDSAAAFDGMRWVILSLEPGAPVCA
jgi:hypothetical protein